MSTNLGDALHRDRDIILDDWYEKVRERTRARSLGREAVLNNVPAILDEIAHALSQPHPFAAVERIATGASEEHGRSRVDLGYGIGELGEEYNSLREAILECLDRADLRVDNQSARALHSAIDRAHRAGVECFIKLQQQRLRERQSDFLARLAHDFRNPLATILGTTEVILRTRNDADAPRLLRIQRATRRLLLLVESQLATEAAFRGELKLKLLPLDLALIIDDLVGLMRPRAEAKRVEVRERVEPNLSLVSDPLLLAQVIQNLLDNAIKYTDEGSITVSARRSRDDVVLTVEDTGRGISKEALPHIFEMYERSEHASPGHGLGLAMVQEILRALRGKIFVSSVEGVGTQIEVRVPATLPVEAMGPEPSAATAPPS